ncbi:MAG TPA: HEPN domain-containing protein [Verrucomicrobiae bacterium]|nr:HEPN domain-containing protein [Verrucomicrobiae bacterium]
MSKRTKPSIVSQNPVGAPAKPVQLPSGPTIPASVSGVATSAYDIFKLCIVRAKNLLKIHEAAHGNQARPEAYLADAPRAAIVLCISALDAYVRTHCLEKIRAIVADRNRELPKLLAEEIKRLIKDDHLLEAARKDDLLSRVEKAFREEFERRSFQGVKNITVCFQLIGIEDIFHEVAICASVNEDNLRVELSRFTKRRHAIAHQGDYDLTQNPPIENSIRKKDAEECIRLVSLLAATIHHQLRAKP